MRGLHRQPRGLSVPVRPHVRVRAVRHGAKRLPHLPQALAAYPGVCNMMPPA